MRFLPRFIVILFSLAVALVFVSCERATTPTDSSADADATIIEDRYIVVLDESQLGNGKTVLSVEKSAQEILSHNFARDFELEKVYVHAMAGFVTRFDEKEIASLQNDSRVTLIEKDQYRSYAPPWDRDNSGSLGDQVVPWGITRVGGATDATGKVAWVIDSGVDLDHPDLNVDLARSVTFVDRTTTANDDNGHGTHVSGTIAALDNEVGVVGVAAGATIVGVKVLNKRGSGYTSDIIAGIEYVAANATPGDVANMSLGGGVTDALDLAVVNASNYGIYFALAAGNESDDANNHSPARANGTYIYTVSAFDNADVFATFSNYGNPPIDFGGPGVSILSLYYGGGTATMSGTSMAAPHIAGLLLVTNGNINTDGYVINDPDGEPDPIAHN
jgi:subtilisin family serine protease